MTAAHGRPLRVVPDPGDTVEEPSTAPVGAHCPDVAEPETWEAQQVFDQWDPEHQLIGALMWLSAEQARPILQLVPDTAIWQPKRQWAIVMYSRTPFGSLDTVASVVPLCRRSALAANSRMRALSADSHRTAAFLDDAVILVWAGFAIARAVIDKLAP